MRSFAVVLLLALAASASAMVVGIDFGSQYFKISLVKPGAPFQIVTNVHTKRKTESLMVLHDGERSFGGDAVTLATRKPQKAYHGVRGYLGRTAEHPWVQARSGAYVASNVAWNETRQGLSLAHAEQSGEAFLAEEVAAMVFSHAKEITAAYAEAPVKDAVLTVPAFFTQSERQALADAAEVAGFNVLALIDENAAAGVQYGIDRVYENATHRVLFYNMGASALQVSVVEYTSYEHKKKSVGQVTTVAKAWDELLGGEAFDLRITEELADKFNEQVGQAGFDVRSQARPMAKLKVQAEKVKKILSANAEIPVHVAGLWDDRDFASHMTRARFEELSADLFQRAVEPVREALADAGLEPADIDAVELLGGGTRIPRLQQQLREFFGEAAEVGAHLNTDEAPALGAAFHAANLSTAFRVRQVGFTDVLPFAVDARLSDLPVEADGGVFGGLFSSSGDEAGGEAWTKHASPFPRYSKLKTPKKVSFLHDKDVRVVFEHPEFEDKLPAGHGRLVGEYAVTGVAEFAAEKPELGTPKVQLSFALGADGQVRVVKAEAMLEEELPLPSEEASEASEESDGEAAEEGAETETDEAETKETEETEETKETKETKKAKKAKKSKSDEDEEETDGRFKVHRRKLTVTPVFANVAVRPLSRAEVSASQAMLADMQAADDARRENAAAKNGLESFIYATKGRMYDDEEAVNAVSTEEQRQAVFDLAMELEDWLYDDGYDETAKVYRQRKRELTDLAGPIFERAEEAEARPAAVQAAREALQRTREKMAEWREERPHVTDEDHDEVDELIGDVERWLQEKLDEQAGLAAHEEPAFKSTEVGGQLKRLKALVGRLSRKQPPKVESSEEDESGSGSGEEGEAEEVEGEEAEAEAEEEVEAEEEAEEAADEHDDL